MAPLNTRQFIPQAIYPAKEFKKIIARECDRVDRYDQRLSVAVFEIDEPDDNSLMVRQLVRILHNRFRDVDDLGWINKKQIGVILPYTPTSGAWKVAEDVCEMISTISNPPPFTIYTYPSENWPLVSHKKIFARFNLKELFFKSYPKSMISSQNEFRLSLKREIDRSMRHSHLFSLVIFKIEVIENTDVSGNAFITRLVERLRTSDEVGWYDRKQLGLILPYTDGSDAGIVAENICNIKESTNIFDVFTYPDNWFDVEWRSDNKRVTVNTAQSVIKEKSEVREVKVDVPEVKKADEVVDQAGGIKLEDYSRFFPGFKFPFWKRTLDIFGSSMGIIFLSPLFIIVAVLIKLSSRGTVFFKQDRLGFRQEKFKLYKFRTMYSDSDTSSHSQYLRKLIKHADNEPMTKLIDDPRVFRLGKILRMTYIDELPQLINVLRGEMSLVGPRPCLPYEAEEYLQWHKRRFFIKPGLTGLWQVSGKNKLTFKSMIRMDIKYEIERTIWLDLKIIFKTIPTIILEAFEDSGNR